MGWACSTHGGNKYFIQNFGRKPEGKIPLLRPTRSWEDNIRMDLRKIRQEGVDWMHVFQDRNQWWVLVNTVVNRRLP
jgi:hypothetical protein